MPNMRVVSDNAIDRATLSADTTAGALAVTNLQGDFKSAVWRSTAKTATLTAIWSALEFVGCVCLPFTNLTASATIRVRGYTNSADSAPLFDTGAVTANPNSALGIWDWGSSPLGVNSFAYGGGTYGTVWFAIQPVRKIVVDIADSANASNYVEAGRLIAGTYWSPDRNPSYGAQPSILDTSKHERNDNGDMMTTRGAKYRKLTMPLNDMSAADRAKLWNILRVNGMSKPMLVSLFPQDADPDLEQAHQIYGKLTQLSAITISNYSGYSSSLELEEA